LYVHNVFLAKVRSSPGFLLEASLSDFRSLAPRYLLLARERAGQLQIKFSRVSIAHDSSHCGVWLRVVRPDSGL